MLFPDASSKCPVNSFRTRSKGRAEGGTHPSPHKPTLHRSLKPSRICSHSGRSPPASPCLTGWISRSLGPLFFHWLGVWDSHSPGLSNKLVLVLCLHSPPAPACNTRNTSRVRMKHHVTILINCVLSTKGWQGNVNYFCGLGQLKNTNDSTLCQIPVRSLWKHASFLTKPGQNRLIKENQTIVASCEFKSRKLFFLKKSCINHQLWLHHTKGKALKCVTYVQKMKTIKC